MIDEDGPAADARFTVSDLLTVLDGTPEYSADGSRMTIRNSSWVGRTFDVDIAGAVAYLNSAFLPRQLDPGRRALDDALSYFDLEIQEFTGTTPPAGDPVIIDENGPRLTRDVGTSMVEFMHLGEGQWFARGDGSPVEDEG